MSSANQKAPIANQKAPIANQKARGFFLLPTESRETTVSKHSVKTQILSNISSIRSASPPEGARVCEEKRKENE